MNFFATKVVHRISFAFFLASCFFCYVECNSQGKPGTGDLAKGRGENNFLMVLNTTEPLYLYCWSVNGSEECNRTVESCIVDTGACEHIRKTALTTMQYNFTNSFLTSDHKWTNESYMGNFVTSAEPPTEMNVTNITAGSTGNWDVQLRYNQPDTYNCSVVTIKDRTSNAPMMCAMYIRGDLPNGTYPPVSCQEDYDTHCPSAIIYKSYMWNCSSYQGQ
ncbi:uncharacterized protein LOC119402902 [Rhipicephalus sanguineus]|uniref:uncharacterized protein LOC119402902 n=1 Tax=Rhipicephalus sanguineus TaxID=34632 RepID=UPI001895D2A4|nr:uncharacterized protein LOC119402902 [Rhipicephalus sanguineus]